MDDIQMEFRPYNDVKVMISILSEKNFKELDDGNIGLNDGYFLTVEDRDGFRILAKLPDRYAAQDLAMFLKGEVS